MVHGKIPLEKVRGAICYPLVRRVHEGRGTQGASIEVMPCRHCMEDMRRNNGKLTTIAQNKEYIDSDGNTYVKKANPNCPSTRDGWVCQSGLECKTFYQTLGYYTKSGRDYTLIGLKIISGQTHQIRVHMKAFAEWEYNDPDGGVVCDSKYLSPGIYKADKEAGFQTHFLHSFKLGVPRIADSLVRAGQGLAAEPRKKGKRDNFLAPLPQALLKSMELLEFDNANNYQLNQNRERPKFFVSDPNLKTFLKGHKDFQMEWGWTSSADCIHY